MSQLLAILSVDRKQTGSCAVREARAGSAQSNELITSSHHWPILAPEMAVGEEDELSIGVQKQWPIIQQLGSIGQLLLQEVVDLLKTRPVLDVSAPAADH